MNSSCMFCKFPFIKHRDIRRSRVVEGQMIDEITCGNCGAEFKVVVTIERGPAVKNYVRNDADTGGV